jgi:anti-anti-sigma factor
MLTIETFIEEHVIIKIEGDILFLNMLPLSSEIQKYLKETDKDIELDFKNVDFVDSSAIALVVKTYRALREQQRKFYVSNLGGRVYRTFDAIRLLKLLDIQDKS